MTHLLTTIGPCLQEVDPFNGGILHADHSGASATASIFGRVTPATVAREPLPLSFFSTGFALTAILRRKRLRGEFKLNKHITRGL
jgi:hypothetical protein